MCNRENEVCSAGLLKIPFSVTDGWDWEWTLNYRVPTAPGARILDKVEHLWAPLNCFFTISMYRWGTPSSHFTVNIFDITCAQWCHLMSSCWFCSLVFSSTRGFRESCREAFNAISNLGESFSPVFWPWVPRDLYFSFTTVFIWPLLNVGFLISHTNVQFSFGSYWVPAGHPLWLIILWVTAEYAQMRVVRTAWPQLPAQSLFMRLLQRNTFSWRSHAVLSLSEIINVFTFLKGFGGEEGLLLEQWERNPQNRLTQCKHQQATVWRSYCTASFTREAPVKLQV